LDEFHARHDHDAVPGPAGARRLAVAIVGAITVLALTALYFYGSSRTGQPPDEATALVPDAGDTDVAVEPGDVATPPDVPPAGAPDPAAPAVTRPPEAGAPAPAGTGQLVVQSTPSGALVTIDGQPAGLTPVTVPDLALGEHRVQVARPGFVPAAARVDLTPESPTRTLTLVLAAGVDESGPAVGTLNVDSRPRGATVSVDGRRVGTTPLRLPDLAAGAHVVQIELQGYRTVRAEVTIERGRPARVAVTLEPDRR
jgi:hypothetical protein